MLEQERYELHLKWASQTYESLCRRCGCCCGSLEKDPCSQLQKNTDGSYECSTYNDRLGIQKTVSGEEFKCVPVRKILFEFWSGSWQCAYKKTVNSI